MKIELLSDDDILELTNYNCVTSEHDYNFHKKNNDPVDGGLFDYKLFGNHRGEEQRYKLAYYLLCSPIIYPTKLKSLVNYINDNLPMIKTYYNPTYALRSLIFSYYELIECENSEAQFIKDNKYYKLNIKLIDDDNYEIDNFKYQYLGLLGLLSLSSYNLINGQSLNDLNNYININLLISNPIDRPTTIFTKGKKSLPILHQLSQNYKIMININKNIERKLYSTDTSIFDKCLLSLCLNDFVCETIISYNLIGKSSKETTVRSLLSTNILKSGRTTIIGDPNLALDEVSIPRSLLYNSLKKDIIELIESNHLKTIGRIEYDKISELSVKYFDQLLEGLVVIINRNPSLHKYNMLAFKVVINDDYVMKLPLLVTKIFGADFDGDTMSFYTIIDKDIQKIAMDTMSSQSNWIYEKYNNYLFIPRHEILYGLTLLSTMVGDYISYNDVNEVKMDIKNGNIFENQSILLEGNLTCYGRILINQILGFDVFKDILDDHFISTKNIKIFMQIIDSFENKIEVLTKLQTLALNAVTILSNSALSLNELFYIQDSIDNNNNVQDQIKSHMSQEFRKVIESNDRLKFNSLIDIIAKPTRLLNNTLLEGMAEDNYIQHTVSNRVLLNVKQTLVPTSGYITRQLASVGMAISYKQEFNDNPSTIIIDKSWLKNNRTIVDNIDKDNIEIISSVFNDSNCVYENEIDNDRFNYTNDHPIGLSLMTSLTEELTQSALSLKHGGRLYFEDDIEFTSQEDTKITDIKDNVLLLNNNRYYILPYGYNHLPIGSIVNKGDKIVWGKQRHYVDYKLEGFKLLINLNASKLLNKTDKFVCYSPDSGTITYDLTKQKYDNKYVDGLILLNGKVIDVYNKNLVYFYANGDIINKYERLSTGIIDLYKFNNLSTLKDTFYIFCKQYYELFGNNVNIELLEILFKLIYKNDFSVKKTLRNKTELLDSLAFGNIKDNLNKFLTIIENDKQEYSLIQKVLLCQ
jgi:hypothetical protein